jgi:hypothetical protein
MTLGGWIFLILSWAVIIALCVFCFWKVFQLQRMNISAPLELDTEAHEKPPDENNTPSTPSRTP